MKIPVPMMPPITSMVASNKPSRRARDCVVLGFVCGVEVNLFLARTNLKRGKLESIANPPIDSLQSGIYYGGILSRRFSASPHWHFLCFLPRVAVLPQRPQAAAQLHQRPHQWLPAVVTFNHNRPRLRLIPALSSVLLMRRQSPERP